MLDPSSVGIAGGFVRDPEPSCDLPERQRRIFEAAKGDDRPLKSTELVECAHCSTGLFISLLGGRNGFFLREPFGVGDRLRRRSLSFAAIPDLP